MIMKTLWQHSSHYVHVLKMGLTLISAFPTCFRRVLDTTLSGRRCHNEELEGFNRGEGSRAQCAAAMNDKQFFGSRLYDREIIGWLMADAVSAVTVIIAAGQRFGQHLPKKRYEHVRRLWDVSYTSSDVHKDDSYTGRGSWMLGSRDLCLRRCDRVIVEKKPADVAKMPNSRLESFY